MRKNKSKPQVVGSWAMLLAALLAALPAFSVVVRHDRDLARTLELGSRYPFTGAAGGSTGTLIGTRWVLTAAHVVENFSPFDFHVRFGERSERVVRTFLHPVGEPEKHWDRRRHDIALLLLEEPVEGIAPAPLYEGDDELGKTAVIVGVGFFGTAETGPVHKDGRRRAVTNRVLDMDDDWLKLVFNRPPGGTDLEGTGAPGDSGGPLLVETDGTAYVAGVSSYAEFIDAEGDEGSYGVLEGYARVSSYIDWIREVRAAVAAGAAVGSEGPRPASQILSARDGLPDTPAGRRATAYFQAFNSGDAKSYGEFTLEHRAAASLAGASMEERIEGYHQAFAEWGRLELLQYAVTGREELSVQVRSQVGEMVFGFAVEAQPPHKLTRISVGY